ncbi:MAG: ketopantoate reductase family protein [Bacteroidetes bacterium]|nr:MAG: ketopantoate reductase family protein [Bacteroidota bacterium]
MDTKKYKIGVVGLGPVGLILSTFLKEADCDIAICDMLKEKMNLIHNEGITLVGKMEKHCFFNYAFSSLDEILSHGIDILICSVKAYHVDYILDQIVKHNKNDNLLIISAQNGIGVATKYAERFAESRVFRMVVNFAGNLFAPNTVNVTFFNPPNYIASKDDSRNDVSQWYADVLNSVGLSTESTDSFTQTNKVWEKTILNAALSPLCAISKLTMKEAMSDKDTNEIVEKLILEAMEVAKAEEIKLPDNFVKLCIRYLKNAGDHFPSLAVDLMNKHETEIEYMNGKIVEFGRKHYVRTPLNLTFTNLVRAITNKNLVK